jgi:hypothetical protein
VDNDGVVSILYGNGTQRKYNLLDTIFMFQKETVMGIFRAVAFEWVIKATDTQGNTDKIYAYAFSKSDFKKLTEHVGIIYDKFYEEGVRD